MKRSLFIGTVLFVGIFFAKDLFSATFDLTGTWNYTLSNNWAVGGIQCNPGPDASGACTIDQTGDTFTFSYTSGVVCDPSECCTFSGTIDSAVYTCSTTDTVDDEGGSVTSIIVFTASSATSAFGSGASEYTHPSEKWECLWGSDITLTKSGDIGDNDGNYIEDNDGDGHTIAKGDCNDNDNTIFPGAIEICDDGIDQDCDGHDETMIDGPTAPRGLAANAVSYRKILLRWTDKSDDEDGFKIERKKKFCSDDTYNWSQIATVSGDNKYEDVDDFDLGIKYSYRVRAYKGLGNSEYSNCGVTTTASATRTPSAPVNLVATNASSSTVDLAWDEWSSNVTEFKIYRETDDSDSWTLLATTGPTTLSYRDRNASGNQSATGYCYYVQACNDKGCSPPTYTVCMPFNPTGLTATAGSSKIILNWEDNSDNERGFELYRKTGDCFSTASWEKVKQAGIDRTIVSDKKDLISGIAYSYKIRAYCRSWGLPYVYGYSAWSNCISISAP